MCQVLEVSKSGYYKWNNKKSTKREQANTLLAKEIRLIYYESKMLYGVLRIKNALKKKDINCNKKRVARFMRKMGISSKIKRKFKATTNSKHNFPVCKNLLNQNFKIQEINKVWASDITYVYTKEGWLYLSVIMDLCSRKIVGWSMSENMKKELVIKALNQALSKREIGKEIIHHSDRGSQYASYKYQNILKENGFKSSMSKKGDCYDNAVVESFFHTLKTELIYLESYNTREEAKNNIFEYIEVFYNRKRLHSTLDYNSPEEFEKMNKKKLAA